MPKVSSMHAWVETGYNLFAKKGLDAIQVEPFARAMGMNKSGFYHYFGDRDAFLEEMIKHHEKQARIITGEYHKMSQLIPDFVDVLMRYPTPILAHMQLIKNKQNKFLIDSYNRINVFVDQGIVPFWASYIGLSHNMPLALQYFEMIRDTFYSRVTADTYNAEYITALITEAKQMVIDLTKDAKTQ